MKRFHGILLALCLVLALCLTGCGGKQAYNENLLENGNFEAGTGSGVSGWVLDRYDSTDDASGCGAVTMAGAPEGSNVLKLESVNFNDARYNQTVSVLPGAYYRLSARVRTDDVTPRSADSGANVCLLQTYMKSDYIGSGSDWHEVVLYGYTDKSTKEVTVSLRLGYYSADCKGVAYFDDVSFMRVNEEDIPENYDVMPMAQFSFSGGSDPSKEGDKTVGGIETGVVLRAVLYALLTALAFIVMLRKKESMNNAVVNVVLVISLIVQLIAAVLYVGFKVDINCFSSWGSHMASVGPFKFYGENYFCDYPPLYMLVLGLLSLPKWTLSEGLGLALLKLPAILCNLIAAKLLQKVAKKELGEEWAAILACLYLLNPTAILNAAVWGQVDSILVLFMLLALLMVQNDRFGLGVILYFVGILFKPQALLFGPVMLLAAVREFETIFACYKNNEKREGGKRLLYGFGGLGVSLLLFLILSLTMANGQKLGWLVDKYMDTFGSYNYATLSSFGLMGLLGGQWAKAELASPLGLPWGTLGTLFVVLAVVAAVLLYLYVHKKQGGVEKKYFWLLTSFLVAAVVIFASRTHERYLFPIPFFLLMTYVYFRDRRLLWIAGGFSLLNFVNTGVVLYLYENLKLYMSAQDAVMIVGSLLTVLLFVYLACVTWDLCSGKMLPIKEKDAAIMKKKNETAAGGSAETGDPAKVSTSRRLNLLLAGRSFKLPKVTWKDLVIVLLLTALYSVIAFSNLGNTESPQTLWESGTARTSLTVDLGSKQAVDTIMYHPSGKSGGFGVEYSDDNQHFTTLTSVTLRFADQGLWTKASETPFSARYVKLTVTGDLELDELAFLKDGAVLPVAGASATASPLDGASADTHRLFDAQDHVLEALGRGIPQTGLIGPAELTVTFDGPQKISYAAAYMTSCELGELTMTGGKDNVTVCSFASGGWNTSDVWTDSMVVEAETLTVSVPEACELRELMFFDENRQVLPVKAVTGAEGADCLTDEPETYEQSEIEDICGETFAVSSAADYVIADFGKTVHIDRGLYFASVCKGNFSVYYSYDGVNWSAPEKHEHDQGMLYYWHGLPGDNSSYSDLSARYVLVVPETSGMRLLEMGFFENADDETPIPFASVTASVGGETGGASLFDEQSMVPNRASYMNSMYFDEIYHARTAYESLHGMSIYEWTHPPLGKDMISWGITIFGMTPFGWRFAGTLAGVLMIPVMYFIGLLMFRKRTWATVLSSLMLLDGMHFVQTRLATVDSYGVLFILLMFLFMYWYYSLSFYDTSLKKTFVPLGLCGIAFGLGAASKWIGLYAGAGLAVLFFITLYRRWDEYNLAKRKVKAATGEQKEYLQHIIKVFPKNTILTLLFCVLFFIIIPGAIYCASYYPYFNVVGETRPWYQIVLKNQADMYNYHSNLDATHGFQSDWYTWPVIYRPMWYYSGSGAAARGTVECISCFGNPVIWYAGLVATLVSFGVLVRRLFFTGRLAKDVESANGLQKLLESGDGDLPDRAQRDTRLLLFLTIGIACNLLPWVGVSRCIFIYHYFASVPFIMMFTVYQLRNICRRHRWVGLALIAALLVIAVVLFFMFKPVWTGTPVARKFVEDYLVWFDSWIFYTGY